VNVTLLVLVPSSTTTWWAPGMACGSCALRVVVKEPDASAYTVAVAPTLPSCER
jgi:hypothetical protein